MTRIVAIDTTSEFGSLALVEDGQVVEEMLLHSPDGFAHILFPQLVRLMDRHGWRFEMCIRDRSIWCTSRSRDR